MLEDNKGRKVYCQYNPAQETSLPFISKAKAFHEEGKYLDDKDDAEGKEEEENEEIENPGKEDDEDEKRIPRMRRMKMMTLISYWCHIQSKRYHWKNISPSRELLWEMAMLFL